MPVLPHQSEMSRKERRKEQRSSKKRRKQHQSLLPLEHAADPAPSTANTDTKPAPPLKRKKKLKRGIAAPSNNTAVPSSSQNQQQDKYAHIKDDNVAAALRRDDEEIAFLERQLGTQTTLYREYEREDGFGNDFGLFLESIDTMVERVYNNNKEDGDEEGGDVTSYQPTLQAGSDDSGLDASSSADEEVLPMKEPARTSMEEEYGRVQPADFNDDEEDENNHSDDSDSSSDDSNSSSADHSDSASDNNDSSNNLTYRPTKGEDIYGNKLDGTAAAPSPKKYVPPHLRNRSSDIRTETLKTIQRQLNSALNRLSEDTLVPVSKSIVDAYAKNPNSDVNDCLWQNVQDVCVHPHQSMHSLIPVYMASLAGVHIQKGETVQLAEYLVEQAVSAFMRSLDQARAVSDSDHPINKESANLLLIICYMYNFNVAHCSLLYDIIRDLIQSFQEVDIELLLLILSHGGRTLRSDDPSALKEIVLMVQQQHQAQHPSRSSSSSRTRYMVDAVMDLKNSKRRKQDQGFVDTTTKLRKALGHIKSGVATGEKKVRSSDACLRIRLQDILNVETKGRWWKVGASWAGNQTTDHDDEAKSATPSSVPDDVDETLLKLASKYRMNTDIRRSVFCVIMGSEDYEDCLEKLVRGNYLRATTERDTVRVLMECCGNETSYNEFYGHLSTRICEYQQKSKFTFQLAFWDTFKQFDSFSARKVANLAKLLYQLVAVHNCLKLSIIKAIDMANTQELSENAMIFLTIFLSSVLQYCEDSTDVRRIFSIPAARKEVFDKDDGLDDHQALKASLTVFLVQVMKNCPKYKKGSKFRANLKAAVKACDVTL